MKKQCFVLLTFYRDHLITVILNLGLINALLLVCVNNRIIIAGESPVLCYGVEGNAVYSLLKSSYSSLVLCRLHLQFHSFSIHQTVWSLPQHMHTWPSLHLIIPCRDYHSPHQSLCSRIFLPSLVLHRPFTLIKQSDFSSVTWELHVVIFHYDSLTRCLLFSQCIGQSFMFVFSNLMILSPLLPRFLELTSGHLRAPQAHWDAEAGGLSYVLSLSHPFIKYWLEATSPLLQVNGRTLTKPHLSL